MFITSLLLSACSFLSPSHAIKRSRLAPLHGEEEKIRLWQSLPLLSPADLWHLEVLWLIWSVPPPALTLTAVFLSQAAIPVSLLVIKGSPSLGTSRFYSLAFELSLQTPFFDHSGCESGTHTQTKKNILCGVHVDLIGINPFKLVWQE